VIDYTSTHIVNPVFDTELIFGAIIAIFLVTYQIIELPFVKLSKRIAPFRPFLGAPIHVMRIRRPMV
jgi:hypothetical protein